MRVKNTLVNNQTADYMTPQENSVAFAMYRALRNMPCTCITPRHAWPSMPKDGPEKKCARCRAIEQFEAFTVRDLSGEPA
jgi:hypothetical protein